MKEMSIKHRAMAGGEWFKLTLLEQMGNIGSEVSRVIRWQNKDKVLFQGAVERCLELFDLTLAAPRWTSQKREICRSRELFVDALYGGENYHTSLQDMMKYFDQFALAARKDY